MKSNTFFSTALVSALFLSSVVLPAYSQVLPEKSYPHHYFRNPLNIPMSLSANFGELRSNHWHMGLDIRTNQRQNLPVFAAADGYISRVSVQPFGFGQAIYINHPNGMTTVYGHLNAFYPELAAKVKEIQYQKESWKIDESFSPGQFPVKKGQQIALSGNTGGSQGPHVHFEIRDTKTENCLNPLLFGFADGDKIAPSIGKLALYDRERTLMNQSPRLINVVAGAGNHYTTNPRLIETGSRLVSFAINATDRTNISSGRNGIYSALISLDGLPQVAFQLDEIGYDETLYLNAQIDYSYKYRGGMYLQHLSRLPGDHGPVYHLINGNGVIELKDADPHHIEITVKDATGNSSILAFDLKFNQALSKPGPVNHNERFIPNYISVLERSDFEAVIKENTLYDTLYADYSKAAGAGEGTVSSLFHLNGGEIPVHQRFDIRIKPAKTIPAPLKSKVVLKRSTGKADYTEKVKWEGDWVTATSGNFGTFQAFIDTKPPALNELGKGDTVDLSHSTSIVFRPEDNFEEIPYFRAELDGKWLMFTNDKGRAYIYRFDENCPPGIHHLKISVMDLAGNRTEKEWWFERFPGSSPLKKAPLKKPPLKKTVTTKKKG